MRALPRLLPPDAVLILENSGHPDVVAALAAYRLTEHPIGVVAVVVTLVFVPHVMAAGTGAGLVGIGMKILAGAFGNSGASCGSERAAQEDGANPALFSSSFAGSATREISPRSL